MKHLQHIMVGAVMTSAVCLSAAPPRQKAEITVVSDVLPEAEASLMGGAFELRAETMGLNAGADSPMLMGGQFTLIGETAAADRRDQDQPDAVDRIDDDVESLWPVEEMENPPVDHAPGPSR